MTTDTTWAADWERRKEEERQKLGLRSAGPCVVCDQQTAYSSHSHHGMYDRYGNKWLDRQFEPAERAGHIEAMTEGIDFTRTREALFRQFVCAVCRDRLEREWPQKARARHERHEEEWTAEEKRRDDERFRRTWRMPQPEEFTVASGQRQFLVRSLDKARSLLTFRWRTCLSQQCRGDVPAQRVGLWVKKRLCAHYYGWQLDGEDGDLFGPGAASWLAMTFQRELLKIKPGAIWYARPNPQGRKTDYGWQGLDTLHICNYGQGLEYPGPCVIHTVWVNGTVYAQLWNFHTIQEVTEFAWERLGVSIRDRDAA
jgi:hypothetical protein